MIAVDLQGHGHTADVDRPLRPETMADDVAALIEHLGLERADVMGYSLGGLAALGTAIQHPQLVRRLVLVSIAFRRDGNHPDALAAMDAMSAEAAEMMKQSPLYAHVRANRAAPRGLGEPGRQDGRARQGRYDWTDDVRQLTAPTLLVYADADSVRPDHVVEFFALLGGGLRDAGWDGAHRPVSRLAVLPGHTHYDVSTSPALAPAVIGFLDAD